MNLHIAALVIEHGYELKKKYVMQDFWFSQAFEFFIMQDTCFLYITQLRMQLLVEKVKTI